MTHRTVRAARLAAALLAVALLGGCVTLSKFDVLKERVDALEKEKADLAERLTREESRLENLHTRIRESQDDLRKTGADQGATLDELRMQLASLSGKLEEMAFRTEGQRQQLQAIVDVLDQRFGTAITVAGASLPEDKDALFQLATQRLTQGNANEARSVFRVYIQRDPKDSRADDAQYAIAESYVLENKPDLAIREYQALHDQYPDSELIPKALWRIHELLVAGKDCKKATAILQYLRDTHKKSPEAARVPDRLKELKKSCK
jgi:TolA-binding protein